MHLPFSKADHGSNDKSILFGITNEHHFHRQSENSELTLTATVNLQAQPTGNTDLETRPSRLHNHPETSDGNHRHCRKCALTHFSVLKFAKVDLVAGEGAKEFAPRLTFVISSMPLSSQHQATRSCN
ncbi:hypothetical protein ABW21_db0206980 [Orbilia brochopaga]|nr:hypothetical protein ABW21_db0206980 [Drechslerella brochopaga]